MDKQEMLEGLKDRPYDFIACNYWMMDKDDLKDILLEVLALFDGADYERIKEELPEALKEYRSWDED